jgi:hypothetical protein
MARFGCRMASRAPISRYKASARCTECDQRQTLANLDAEGMCVDVTACEYRIHLANSVGILAPAQRRLTTARTT